MTTHPRTIHRAILALICCVALTGCDDESSRGGGPDASGPADMTATGDSAAVKDTAVPGQDGPAADGPGPLDPDRGVADLPPASDQTPPPDMPQQLDGGGAGSTKFSFFAVADTRSDPSVAQLNFQSMSQLDPQAIALFNSGDITSDGYFFQWPVQEQAATLGSGGQIRLDVTHWNSPYIRYFGVIGNHDIHAPGWRANWNKHLSGQAGLGHNAADGIWFTVQYGHALFIVLDSEHSTGAQTSWLKQVLADAAQDPSITWKFVFYHRPVYPCNYKSPWDSGIPWVREFETHGVDMVFNGHAHVYERTCPMVGGSCQAGGVVYVTSGGGGASTGDVDPTKTETSGPDSYDCGQIIKAAKGHWHHYCHIQLDGGTLTYNCYAHDATAAPEDTHTIVK